MSIDKELADINPSTGALLTIGVFDGVHLGHQRLLKELRDKASDMGLATAVITFKAHPLSILTSGKPVKWLGELNERIKLIKEQGIDTVIALSFTKEVKDLSASDFIHKLHEHFNLKGLIVGPDFALGKGREGNIKRLKELGSKIGYFVEVMPPFIIGDEVVRSSRIRKLVAEGDVAKAGRFLGRPFVIRGKVITGDGRGRTLGFPTVNLDLDPDMAIPKDGVYATITRVDDWSMPSVTNIGTRPTFGVGKRTKETHILNFNGNLVGEMIEVSFIDRLRDETKFSSEEELKEQINIDINEAENIFR
jgi:riboflavin kinase/FMN adenylyltransferase